MKIKTILILLLLSINCYSQEIFTGKIGNSPITLVIQNNYDEDIEAIYSYDKYDTPISIDGTLNDDTLTLYEIDNNRDTTAIITIHNFNETNNRVQGKWKNLATNKTYSVILNKSRSTNENNSDLLQFSSTKKHYFKSFNNEGNSGMKVFEKGTDRLIQTMELEWIQRGIYDLKVGDFNFDGYEDFSLLDETFAGPNTRSSYYLYNPKTNKYFESDFFGLSLKFDEKTKTITERNQCCAGSQVTTAIYKVRQNEMVLIEEHCYKWDDKTDELIEREMEECK